MLKATLFHDNERLRGRILSMSISSLSILDLFFFDGLLWELLNDLAPSDYLVS